jgi:hypothetical protein
LGGHLCFRNATRAKQGCYRDWQGYTPFVSIIITCVFILSEELKALIRAFNADSPILESTTWLIAFDVGSAKVLVIKGLGSDSIGFVRHNKRILYYGI